MASRSNIRVLVGAVVMLCASTLAYGQSANPPQEPPAVSAAGAPATEQRPAAEQNEEPEWRWRFLSIGGDVNETSAYVWRGWVLHDGTCLQPDVWVKVSDFTVTSWMNVRHSIPDDSHLNEFDFIVDYSRDVSLVTLSAGWQNYRFFGNQSGRTNEFYAGVRANVLFQPGVQVYQDVDNAEGDGSKGTYVSLSVGHEFPLGKHLNGAAQVALGYNHHQYIAESGFSDVAFTFKLGVPVASGRVSLQPTLTYSHSLMPEIEGMASRVYGGLAVAFK